MVIGFNTPSRRSLEQAGHDAFAQLHSLAKEVNLQEHEVEELIHYVADEEKTLLQERNELHQVKHHLLKLKKRMHHLHQQAAYRQNLASDFMSGQKKDLATLVNLDKEIYAEAKSIIDELEKHFVAHVHEVYLKETHALEDIKKIDALAKRWRDQVIALASASREAVLANNHKHLLPDK